MTLGECLDIDDLLALARRRLPKSVYPHLIGGAEMETTLARNTTAFDEVEILPNSLVDVSAPKTGARILGLDMAWPLFCSPTGASRLFHPEGELAVARAAGRADTLYGLSTVSTYSIEQVAAASPAPKIFQTFIFKDRGLTLGLVERAKAAGYKALFLTVDSPIRGNCVREMREGMMAGLSLRHLADLAFHPAWSLGQARKGALSLPFAAEATGEKAFAAHSRFVGEQLDLAASWQDVRRIADAWGGPLAIKGIMTADDARRAIDAGAGAVIVSNHGGRQLDGAAAAVAALPAVARAVGDRIDVILDGGVRRGVHILKALALGAKACSIGRPYLFGLAAGGEAGVLRALEILRSEFERAMRLAGCNDAARIDPSILVRLGGG